MKKFLLFLSALFVGVSFATAQTYEISTSTGTLVGTENKKSAWVANDCPAGLKITATDANGKAVNTITVLNSCYKFYAVGLFPGTENLSTSPTTYTISVEDGYLITGYSMTYYPSTANKVTISNEYNYSETPSSAKVDYYMTATGLSTKSTTFTVSASNANYAACALEFTVTVKKESEGEGDGTPTPEELYASIKKPSFGKAGNTTFVKAATLAGDVNAEVAGIQAVVGQACVTNAIPVEKGAQFDLNITYQLNWGDLAIYQIDNDGATKEYGYYYGSWEPNGSTAKVAQYIAEDGISISEVVDGACTATFPITINENHNPGDVIVVRAITGVINNATNSAYEQGISEGGYVDFLFVVTESVAEVWSSFYATFPAVIPEGIEAYIVTAVNSSYVTLTQIHDAIPAETGVILKGGSIEANINNYYGGEITADVTANLLMGSNNNSYITEEAYVLSNVDGEYGFYKALMTDGAWLNNANKAYLPASAVPAGAAMSASLRFDFDGTTAIEEVETEAAETVIYDLTGRRVNEITKAGVYVVNGKKILVK